MDVIGKWSCLDIAFLNYGNSFPVALNFSLLKFHPDIFPYKCKYTLTTEQHMCIIGYITKIGTAGKYLDSILLKL